MLRTVLVLLSLVSSTFAFQVDSVKYVKKLDASFNLTNTSISDNWYKGGNSSLNWQFDIVYNFVRDAKSSNFTHTGKFSFGKSELDGIINPSRITANEFKHESIYTHKVGLAVEPFVSASIQTQVARGFNYESTPKTALSDIFDPAYFTQALGLGYTSKDLAFNARAGFALKETVSSGDTLAIALTDDPETKDERETLLVEKGLKLNASYKKKFDRYEISTAIEIFSELDAINQTDAFFDFTISTSVTDYLKMSFDLDIRYDADISKSRQMKNVLAIGLQYSFF